MSSTEPPSRNNPRNQPQDAKAARDELSSKGKVEKVREIDADEQTRKQKFLKYYKDDAAEEEKMEAEKYPRPYDLYAGQDSSTGNTKPTLGSSNSLGDAEDAIVPAPAYTPPPTVNSFPGNVDNGEAAASTGALPQSEDFWEEFDMPDQPMPPANFQETTNLSKTNASDGNIRSEKKGSNPGVHPFAANQTKGKKEGAEEKKQDPSPFGPPGKPVTGERKPDPKQGPFMRSKESAEKKLPSPFDPPAKNSPQSRPIEKEEERSLGPIRDPIKTGKRTSNTSSTKEEDNLIQGLSSASFKSEEREGGKGDQKGGDKKGIEIDSSMKPLFPSDIQPMAASATTQAAPYLNTTTMNLFFQMVGTMYVMAGPQGINRTEIVLNNPAFADSKFYGSTITIEKYATAPDSFNIRLTGSNAAVVSFKENIPSLMSAFENGSFAFKVNRLDIEYSMERPVFRRKEKGEDKGEAGGGDLGERRK